MDNDNFTIVSNILAITGVVGMAFTGWWFLDLKELFTFFSLMVLPMCVRIIWDFFA